MTIPIGGIEPINENDPELIAVDDVCRGFPNITYSSRDDDLTQRQVKGFNAARDALCRDAGNKAPG